MKHLLLFTILCSASFLFSQNKDKNTDLETLVLEIEQVKDLGDPGQILGKEAFIDKDLRAVQLRKIASKKELIGLTEHENPMVRLFAFRAILRRKNINTFPILLKHLGDTATVKYQSPSWDKKYGHVKICDYFLSICYDKQSAINMKKNKFERPFVYNLSLKENTILDSLIIFEHSHSIGLRKALTYYPKSRRVYDRLKMLIENNITILPHLAEYRNPEDKQLITDLYEEIKVRNDENQMNNIFHAIANYPDSIFINLLIDYRTYLRSQNNYLKPGLSFYYACASVNKPATIKLLSEPFENQELNRYSIEQLKHILWGLGEYPSILNKALMIKAFERYNAFSPKGYKYLSKTEPVLTYKLSTKIIQESDSIRSDFLGQSHFIEMLPFMYDYNSKEMKKMMASNIEIIPNGLLYEFVRFITNNKTRNQEYIAPLLKRMEQEKDINMIYYLAYTLVHFKKRSIHKNIITALNNNENLEKQFTSIRAVKKVLKERKITFDY